jgi:uncharacterized protein
MGAAWQNNLKLAKELLDRGVRVNAKNAKGNTALTLAPHHGADGKMVQLLSDAGADPNVKTQDGMTALIAAALVGDGAAADQLLKAGADPIARDKWGHTAEEQACGRGERGHAEVCALVRDALKKKQ